MNRKSRQNLSWLYTRPFICTDIKSKRDNPAHDEIAGSVCYLSMFPNGEHGWFTYMDKDGDPHRIRTSVVLGSLLSEIRSDDGTGGAALTGYRLTVETENSEYIFETKEDQ